jgi:Leucine-rich repeat (LRR) protein
VTCPAVCCSISQIRELPAEIGLLRNLQVLSVAGNAISSLPGDLGSLVNLREVYLGGNPVRAGCGAVVLSERCDCRLLFCCRVQITELPDALAGWTNVEEASFKGCKLKALSPALLAWAKCRRLDLRSGGKKDTCKVPPEYGTTLPEMRIIGGVAAKKGKGKGKK